MMIRRTGAVSVLVVFTLALLAAPQVLARDVTRSQPSGAVPQPAATALTFHLQRTLVTYGRTVIADGFLTAGGAPVAGAKVVVRRVGQTAGGASAKTDAIGHYACALSPAINAAWAATAAGLTSAPVVVRVMPRVTVSLSHAAAGAGLTEYFRGRVSPNHAGSRVLVQRRHASGWRTIVSARLNAHSRYRVAWVLPHRSRTYRLRVAIPEHADHAQGTSPMVFLHVIAGG